MVLTAFLGVASQATAAEYLVKYRSSSALMSVEGPHFPGATVKEINETGRYAVLEIPDADSLITRASLATDSGVEWITPNVRFEAVVDPVTETVDQPRAQWALDKVRAPEAWAMADNGGFRKIIVAVIDTGVDYRHRNLMNNMVAGYDFHDNDNDPNDETSLLNAGHGTHCAGIIGADGKVNGGVSGIAPQTSMMPLRFIGKDNTGDLNSAIKAIDYAAAQGVQVVSSSWNKKVSPEDARGLLEAIQRAEAQGVMFIFTAGNDSADNDTINVFPANAGSANSITVTASDASDRKPSTSSFGLATVHIAAPGDGVISTLPHNHYGLMSGTSEATPLVAGAVALLKAQDSSLTGAQMRALLQITGAPADIEIACHCRLDIASAMDFLIHKKPWLVPAATTIGVGEHLTVQVMNGVAPFTFSSSDEDVLTVDEAGVVTAVAEGTAIVTALDANGEEVTGLDYRVVASKKCVLQLKSVCLLQAPPKF